VLPWGVGQIKFGPQLGTSISLREKEKEREREGLFSFFFSSSFALVFSHNFSSSLLLQKCLEN
jgi:hypothetical protein